MTPRAECPIHFGKSKWEVWESPLQDFLRRAADDGFDAVEIYLPALTVPAREVRDQTASAGLRLVAQISTDGSSPEEHLESLKQRFDDAVEAEPLMINCHTGRDHFPFGDNVRIFQKAAELAEAAGVLFVHETHRGRALFAAHVTKGYLDELPGLWLNGDFSHWFCVHESDLSDQREAVAAAVRRARSLHARVGFEQGPQLPDPFAENCLETLAKFENLWRAALENARSEGVPFFVITPEAGPPPYMPAGPTGQPPDAWEVNVRMLHHLQRLFKNPGGNL